MTRAPSRTARKKQAVAPILAARIGAAPLPSSPKETRQKVSSWLADIAGSVKGKSLKQLLGGSTHVRALIEGIADGSPYLWQLASAEPARLLALLQPAPDAHFAALLPTAAAAVAATDDEAEAMRLLRRMKAEAALLIALCDIGGVWPVMRVTAALTDLAVASVQMALRFLLRQEIARGRMTAVNHDRPEEGSGLIVLAMGKMGAG